MLKNRENNLDVKPSHALATTSLAAAAQHPLQIPSPRHISSLYNKHIATLYLIAIVARCYQATRHMDHNHSIAVQYILTI